MPGPGFSQFAEELDPFDSVAEVWLEPAPCGHLHIFVSLPGGVGNPTLVVYVGKCFIRLFALARDI